MIPTPGSGSPHPGSELGTLARTVAEGRVRRELVTFRYEEWGELASGLVCGVTGAENEEDFGVGTGRAATEFLNSYRALARELGFGAMAVCRQIHGSGVLVLGEGDSEIEALEPTDPEGGSEEEAPAVRVVGDGDGLASDRTDLLLIVTVADCVPVFLLDPVHRVIALLHAGWRGVAAGILERGIGAVERRFGSTRSDLHLHLGPSICVDCYEVGAEVLAAVGVPGPRGGLDLRSCLTDRALREGVSRVRITRSGWCTRCHSGSFCSHRARGARAGRMAAFLGLRRRGGQA